MVGDVSAAGVWGRNNNQNKTRKHNLFPLYTANRKMNALTALTVSEESKHDLYNVSVDVSPAQMALLEEG